MIDFIEKIYFKYKEFWWHLFFGILTIGVSIGTYFVCDRVFHGDNIRLYSAWITISIIAVLVFAILENSRLTCFVDRMYFKYKEIFWYLVFGVLTTVVNLVTYYILDYIFGEGKFLYLIWTAVAWFIAVIFAYITNRKYVFESKSTDLKDTKREFVSFIACRVFSGVIDIVFMYVTVSIFLWSDSIMKIVSNVIVIILNYIFSKLFVFKKN